MTKPNKTLTNQIKTWKKDHDGLRFGQWLFCLLAKEYGGDNSAIGDRLFQVGDQELIDLIKKEK